MLSPIDTCFRGQVPQIDAQLNIVAPRPSKVCLSPSSRRHYASSLTSRSSSALTSPTSPNERPSRSLLQAVRSPSLQFQRSLNGLFSSAENLVALDSRSAHPLPSRSFFMSDVRSQSDCSGIFDEIHPELVADNLPGNTPEHSGEIRSLLLESVSSAVTHNSDRPESSLSSSSGSHNSRVLAEGCLDEVGVYTLEFQVLSPHSNPSELDESCVAHSWERKACRELHSSLVRTSSRNSTSADEANFSIPFDVMHSRSSPPFPSPTVSTKSFIESSDSSRRTHSREGDFDDEYPSELCRRPAHNSSLPILRPCVSSRRSSDEPSFLFASPPSRTSVDPFSSCERRSPPDLFRSPPFLVEITANGESPETDSTTFHIEL